MKFAVLGAGHGGLTMSAELTLKGYSVNLYELPAFREKLRPIEKKGGIEIVGAVHEQGFAKVRISRDIKDAIEDVDVIMIVVPAFAQKHFVNICIPYLTSGQTIVLNTGNFGSLELANTLKEGGVDVVKDITLGETLILVYACRRIAPTQVLVFGRKENLPFAAFPAKNTKNALRLLREAFPEFKQAKNVLETSLNNPNIVEHTTKALLNAARIESTGGDFDWREEPPSVKRLKLAVDNEKMAVARALGLSPISYQDLQKKLYPKGTSSDLYEKLLNAPPKWAGLSRKGSPTNLKMRYITEDVPYGLVPIASIGEMLDVSVSTIKSLIRIACVVNQADYWREGRTAEKLGLAGLTAGQMNTLLVEGKL